MSAAAGLTLLLGTLLGSLWLTWGIREYARRRRLLDHPNDRSAHSTPTPRLGGVGIILPFLTAALAISVGRPGAAPLVVVLCATAGISVLGLVDDLHPLKARWRFAGQVLAAAAVVLHGSRSLGAALAPFDAVLPAPLLAAAAVLWIVWATNLYNFMDGIDGLAGGQALWASAGLSAAAFSLGSSSVGWTLAALGAAAAGFLRFNLPKASIFMGDVGSTAIGFFLAAVPFADASRPLPVLAVALALSLFVLDATTTLIRRVVRGERWFAAHRSHLYQRPLAWGVGHAPITYSAYAGMAVVAAMAARYPVVEPEVRALMWATAVALFLAAWALVRRLGVRCGVPQ